MVLVSRPALVAKFQCKNLLCNVDMPRLHGLGWRNWDRAAQIEHVHFWHDEGLLVNQVFQEQIGHVVHVKLARLVHCCRVTLGG
jgi:hypothetical protein